METVLTLITSGVSALLAVFERFFNKAMNNRLQNKIEEDKKLEDSQAAYRSDHSTVDQLFIFRCLLNKYTKLHNRTLFTCFVDFKKAFDSIGIQDYCLNYWNIII